MHKVANKLLQGSVVTHDNRPYPSVDNFLQATVYICQKVMQVCWQDTELLQ